MNTVEIEDIFIDNNDLLQIIDTPIFTSSSRYPWDADQHYCIKQRPSIFFTQS